VIYVAVVPKRPDHADRVHIAFGIFERFDLGNAPAEMVLTLRDANGIGREYVLAEHTTLNGKPLDCPKVIHLDGTTFCAAFPQNLVPGTTRLAVLYWSQAFSDSNVIATDEIVTLTAGSPVPRVRRSP
jgi:hypothetical protein